MLLEHIAPIESSPLLLQEVDIPQLMEHELLVEVHTCGICRTDLHVIEGDLPSPFLPLIPGHQIVGKVITCGRKCHLFSVGERVGIAWLRHTCNECEFCKRRSENLCLDSKYTGYDQHGGYAEFAIIHEDYAYLIPPSFSDLEASPLLCAGIIGYRALKRSALQPGQKLAIFGFGSSAHITHQIAIHWGCDVFVTTREKRHREMAKEMGATWIGNIGDSLPTKVDSAIVFAPVGKIARYALEALKPGGTVSLAGIHMTEIPALNYTNHIFHEKTLTSVEANTREDGEELLALAASIPLRPRVTTFPLQDANQALQMLKQGKIEGTGVLVCK